MSKNPKGSIILYLNVGNLSAEKTEEFVLKYKTNLDEWVAACKANGYLFVIIPQRDSDTRVEIILF